MSLTALPPVRRAVPLRRGSVASRLLMERFFGDRRITLYTSGTAALAHAITRCAERRPVSEPEVIIPAYGCPDLVAACLYSSVFPRLVDVSRDHWSYDAESLKASLSPSTVAIVAVNLLGLGDSSASLAKICRDRGISLIQDSAQHLPREEVAWPGDYVVISFGRGKPLNLLHGGALVAPPGDAHDPTAIPIRYSVKHQLLASRTAAIAFNVLTRPLAYGLLSSLPGTGIGAVEYTPLTSAEGLPESAWKQVGPAFAHYRDAPSYRRDLWSDAIADWLHIGITALDAPPSPVQPEPLRLALLVRDRGARDWFVARLNRAGFGASRFYGSALPDIAGIPDLVRHQQPFPNAATLAARLFTLPTHGLVRKNMIPSISAMVESLSIRHRNTT